MSPPKDERYYEFEVEKLSKFSKLQFATRMRMIIEYYLRNHKDLRTHIEFDKAHFDVARNKGIIP